MSKVFRRASFQLVPPGLACVLAGSGWPSEREIGGGAQHRSKAFYPSYQTDMYAVPFHSPLCCGLDSALESASTHARAAQRQQRASELRIGFR
jgi:hypothetical protein